MVHICLWGPHQCFEWFHLSCQRCTTGKFPTKIQISGFSQKSDLAHRAHSPSWQQLPGTKWGLKQSTTAPGSQALSAARRPQGPPSGPVRASQGKARPYTQEQTGRGGREVPGRGP